MSLQRLKNLKDTKIGKLSYLKYGLGEIVLVVIGILIAVQINNLNEEYKEKKVKNDFLINLKEEIILDTLLLSNKIVVFEKINESISKGILLLNKKTHSDIETSNFEIKDANFEAFVNGELRIVDIDADGDNDVIYTGGNETTGERGGVIYNTYVPNDNSDSGNYWDSWWQNDQLRSKYSTLEIFKPQDSKAIGYMVMGEGKGYAVNRI